LPKLFGNGLVKIRKILIYLRTYYAQIKSNLKKTKEKNQNLRM